MLAFHDRVEIELIAGAGGGGAVSFRREAYAPKGGPDGGDGGKGGDVILEASDQLTTLYDLYRLKILRAGSGQAGGGKKRSGQAGKDLIVKVPLGSEICEKFGSNWLDAADLTKSDQRFVAAKGGRGGWGNWHFATATRQTPRFARPGGAGERKKVRIILKLLADVGLIGLPNVGKSLLLSKISSAKPKIGDYPFTTLSPNLGMVKYKNKSFVAADIPGLIEGASQGKGLGYQFLQHIERTKILIHLLDATSKNLKQDYETVRKELANFAASAALTDKPEIIAVNKIDLIPNLEFHRFTKRSFKISAATGRGISKLLGAIASHL